MEKKTLMRKSWEEFVLQLFSLRYDQSTLERPGSITEQVFLKLRFFAQQLKNKFLKNQVQKNCPSSIFCNIGRIRQAYTEGMRKINNLALYCATHDDTQPDGALS